MVLFHSGTPQIPFPPRVPSGDAQEPSDSQLTGRPFLVCSSTGPDSQAWAGGEALLLQAPHHSYPFLPTVARPFPTLNSECLCGDKPWRSPSYPKCINSSLKLARLESLQYPDSARLWTGPTLVPGSPANVRRCK